MHNQDIENAKERFLPLKPNLLREGKRRELCGATRICPEPDHHHPERDGAEILLRLANLWLQDQRLTDILFCRLLFPDLSHRQMRTIIEVDAKKRRCGRQTITNLTQELLNHFPEVGTVAQTKTPKARGQRARRNKAKAARAAP